MGICRFSRRSVAGAAAPNSAAAKDEIQNLLQQVGSLVYWSDRVLWMEPVARQRLGASTAWGSTNATRQSSSNTSPRRSAAVAARQDVPHAGRAHPILVGRDDGAAQAGLGAAEALSG